MATVVRCCIWLWSLFFRECMLNMARAANKSHTKRASCLKCGVLWFPLEEPKPSTTKKDPAATPGAARAGPARPEGQGGEVQGQNNIATPASDQPQPTAATEPIVGPAGVHQDMLFAAAALNQVLPSAKSELSQSHVRLCFALLI